MLDYRVCESFISLWRKKHGLAAHLFFTRLTMLVMICLIAPRLAHSLESDAAITNPRVAKPPVESEVIVEGLASYGNYKIFASGYDCKLYTAGLEYDRHSWGYFLKSRMDWSTEVLPVIVLNEPAKADIWGNPMSKDRQILYGVGFSPIGFRMMWRDRKAVRPYLSAKGGILVFNKKAISSESTYQNFTLQSGMGLQVAMTPRVGLRLGLFNDFHLSNGFVVPVNPGLDVMNANLGVSYRLGGRIK